MASMKAQNEVLYYKVCFPHSKSLSSSRLIIEQLLQTHLKEMFSIIYTPTEGDAIENYSRLFRKPEGCFLNIRDQDSIEECLSRFGNDEEVDYIVVSDGEEVYVLIILLHKVLSLTSYLDSGYRRPRCRCHPHLCSQAGHHDTLRWNSSGTTITRGPRLRNRCEYSRRENQSACLGLYF